MASRCQCRDGCRFAAAPGEPYALTHDPRPERQEARAAILRDRGRKGSESMSRNREAAGKRVAKRLSLRTVEGQQEVLDRVMRLLMRSKMDGQRAAAIVATVKAAREVLTTAELERENQDLKRFIAEKFPEHVDKFPELKKLKAVS